jgi:hypothetical protein
VDANKEEANSDSTERFFPKGAITFFAAMLIGFGLIWLGMYLLMIQRKLWL